MAKNALELSVTQSNFDNAMIYLMGEVFCKAVPNRTTQIRQATDKIFIEEYDKAKEPDMRAIVQLVRTTAQRLNKHGQFVWDKD